MVFIDADGCSKFGCDCGQFHLGVGLTEGVYAVSAGDLTPSRLETRFFFQHITVLRISTGRGLGARFG